MKPHQNYAILARGCCEDASKNVSCERKRRYFSWIAERQNFLTNYTEKVHDPDLLMTIPSNTAGGGGGGGWGCMRASPS